jgi:hypothetical protein
LSSLVRSKRDKLEHDIATSEHVSEFFYGDFKAMNSGAVTGSRR